MGPLVVSLLQGVGTDKEASKNGSNAFGSQSFGSTILPRLSEVFRDLHPPRGLNFRPRLSRSGASFGRCCVLGESEVLLGRKSLGSGLETSGGLCAVTSTRRVFPVFPFFAVVVVCVCARVFGPTLSFGVLSKRRPVF